MKHTAKEILQTRFSKKYPEGKIESVELKNREELTAAIQADCQLKFPKAAVAESGFLYFSPVVAFFFMENPFTAQKRICPINFSAPIRAQYVFYFQIPEDYKVEELPQSLNLQMPDNGARFTYSCSETGDGKLQVSARFSLRQIDYIPEAYPAFRDFFDQMIQKLEAQVVLKKL